MTKLELSYRALVEGMEFAIPLHVNLSLPVKFAENILAPGSGEVVVDVCTNELDRYHLFDIAGGNGAIVLTESVVGPVDVKRILVPSVRYSLWTFVRNWRASFPGVVIVVVGSNGKTTTTQMLAAALSRVGSVVHTKDNLNNVYGIPISIAETTSSTCASKCYAVLEVGSDSPGEISALVSHLRPHRVIHTAAGHDHLQGLGGVTGSTHENFSAVRFLESHGVCICNAADIKYLPVGALSADCALETFTVDPIIEAHYANDVRPGDSLVMGMEAETTHATLPAAMGTFPQCFAAVLACLSSLDIDPSGIDVRAGLASFKPIPGRLEAIELRSGIRLLNDTYNANLESCIFAIDALAISGGKKVMILGEVADLGVLSAKVYSQILDYACHRRLDAILLCGIDDQFVEASATVVCVSNHAEAFSLCLGMIPVSGGMSILIKGSRSAKMERLVKLFESKFRA